jgi:hypothetical protein
MHIRSLPFIVLICMVLAALVSGCLGDKTSAPSSPSPPDILVDYQRSGGIAGLNDRLVIFDNGITLVSDKKQSTEIILNSTELEQLEALFNTSRFSELEGNYTSARSGADRIQYQISYRGTTINTEDDAVPQELEPLIAELDRILSGGLSGGPAATMLPRIMT